MPAVQAPRTIPMEDQTPREISQMGAATGELAQAAFRMNALQMRQQNQLDDAAAKELDNLFADSIRKIVYDPKEGYEAKLGRGAIESRDKVFKDIEEARKKLEERAQNPVQRRLVRDAFTRRTMAATMAVDQHYAKQSEIYAIGSAEARIQSSFEDYRRNISKRNFAAATGNWKTGMDEVNAIADLRGVSDDVRKQMLASASDTAHAKMFDDLARGDRHDDAVQYYDFVKGREGEVSPDTLARMGEAVTTINETKMVKSLLESPEMFNASRDEQLNKVHGWLSSGKINERQAVIMGDAVNRMSENQRQQRAQLSAMALQDALSQMQAKSGQLSDINPLTQNQLRSTGMDQVLLNYDRAKKDWDTNSLVLSKLENNPEQLTNLSPEEIFVRYRGSLNSRDFNYVMALRARMTGDLSLEQRSLITWREELNSKLDEMRLTEPSERRWYIEELDRQVQRIEGGVLKNSRQLTNEEIKKVVNDMFVQKSSSVEVLKQGEGTYEKLRRGEDDLGAFVKNPETGKMQWIPLSSIPPSKLEDIKRYIDQNNFSSPLRGGSYMRQDEQTWVETYIQTELDNGRFSWQKPTPPRRESRTFRGWPTYNRY